VLREILARLFYFIAISGPKDCLLSSYRRAGSFFIAAAISFAKTYSAGKFYFKANINILLSFLQLKGGRFYGI